MGTLAVAPWLAKIWIDAFPSAGVKSPIDWMEQNVRLIGSARTEKFNTSITPWTRKPAEKAASGNCRSVTFVKPVQGGGSAAGEAVLCYWLAIESGGNVQYNWEDDAKALQRWGERFERILKACKAVMARAPSEERQLGKWKNCNILFAHCNFTMQGVWQPNHLDSSSIRFQVNEEVHNWEPGRLAKAYARITAVWNATIFNISNAGKMGDQLHVKFLAGTQEHWEVLCPGCGKRHCLKTEFDKRRPELGGLRYDSEGCKNEEGVYDYNKLSKTVRYQMPCGHEVPDDPVIRRRMSLGGDYGAPRNPGALPIHPSFTLEAVSVDYIPWITLIQEKHEALRSLRLGDPEPWWRYLTEREGRFIDPNEDRPVIGRVVLNTALTKNRAGMPNRVARFGALDRQQGTASKGEMPHWWGIILDVDALGNSQLVFEGKMLTDEDAAARMIEHGVKPNMVAVDSGDDTTHVYLFCLKHGFNAIKGSGEANFAHPDGSRKIFSVEKPLYRMLNRPLPSQDNPEMEPLFWHYSKSGIRERFYFLRGAKDVRMEIPGDVSEDFKQHMESEEVQEVRNPKTGERTMAHVQVKKRNDLLVCMCYATMLMDMAGLIAVDPNEAITKAA